MSWQEKQVVMLPTKDKTNKGDLCKLTSSQLGLANIDYSLAPKQHLYILSDEEIKEGDYFIYENEIIHRDKGEVDSIWIEAIKLGKKIIATRDKSLGLPEILQSFIEYFITEYNKGNKIEKVMVEYEEEECGWDEGQILYDVDNPIVKLSNNTISIKPIKDSWSREEVHNLLFNLHRLELTNKLITNHEFDEWIKQNL